MWHQTWCHNQRHVWHRIKRHIQWASRWITGITITLSYAFRNMCTQTFWHNHSTTLFLRGVFSGIYYGIPYEQLRGLIEHVYKYWLLKVVTIDTWNIPSLQTPNPAHQPVILHFIHRMTFFSKLFLGYIGWFYSMYYQRDFPERERQGQSHHDRGIRFSKWWNNPPNKIDPKRTVVNSCRLRSSLIQWILFRYYFPFNCEIYQIKTLAFPGKQTQYPASL